MFLELVTFLATWKLEQWFTFQYIHKISYKDVSTAVLGKLLHPCCADSAQAT